MKSALKKYDKSATELEAKYNRIYSNRKKSEYEVAKKNLWISVGLMAAVWIANAVDFSLNHFLIDRIAVSAVSDEANVNNIASIKYNLNLRFKL